MQARLQQAGTADTDASSPVASDAAAEPIRPLTRSVLSPEDEQLLGTYDYGSMAQGTEQLDMLVLAWHDSSVGSSPACTLLHVAVVGISKAESGTTADALSSDQVGLHNAQWSQPCDHVVSITALVFMMLILHMC